MIVRVNTGAKLRPLHQYVTGEGHDPDGREREARSSLIGGDGFGFDVNSKRREDIALRMMEHDGADSRKVKRPFLQVILSWHPSQQPAPEEQREASRGIFSALNMDRARRLIYRHEDKPHPHVHIIGSRYDPEHNRFYSVDQSINKGIRWSRQWERDHGIPDSLQKEHWRDLPPQVDDDYWKQLDEWGKKGPDQSMAQEVRKLFDAHRQENPLSAADTFNRMIRRQRSRPSEEREDRTLATSAGTKARENEQGLGM